MEIILLLSLYTNKKKTDVENDEIIASDSLELVDLRKNPLTPQCLDRLRNARVSFHIELPERVKEDWEDLDV